MTEEQRINKAFELAGDDSLVVVVRRDPGGRTISVTSMNASPEDLIRIATLLLAVTKSVVNNCVEMAHPGDVPMQKLAMASIVETSRTLTENVLLKSSFGRPDAGPPSR